MNARIDKLYFIPKAELSLHQLEKLKKEVTVRPLVVDERGRMVTGEPLTPYVETADEIGLPIDYAIRKFPNANVEDATIYGDEMRHVRRVPDPHHPQAPDGQADFMNEAYNAVTTRFSSLLIADTGAGKTVVALWLAAQLERKTLIIVPTAQLQKQWVEEAEKHLGLDPSRIGIIRQDLCDYVGKDICIGIIHSLVRRNYARRFYESFGTVAWDEAHITGARSFSESLSLFPAAYKFAVTATPQRKDGAASIFLNQFGDGAVISEIQSMPATVRIVNFIWPRRTKLSGNRGKRINEICENEDRNLFILKWLSYFWKKGRKVLILSDRIEHLEHLRERFANEFDVPLSRLGLFTGSRSGETIRRRAKVTGPKNGVNYWLAAKNSLGLEEDTRVRCVNVFDDFVEVALEDSPTNHEIPMKELRGRMQTVVKRISQTDEDLDRVAHNSDFLFATYGMFKQGQNLPWLDTGIDVTPRSDGVQAVGRIRRIQEGKKVPVWLTIRDVGVKALVEQLNRRVRDYKSNDGITVKEHEAKKKKTT